MQRTISTPLPLLRWRLVSQADQVDRLEVWPELDQDWRLHPVPEGADVNDVLNAMRDQYRLRQMQTRFVAVAALVA